MSRAIDKILVGDVGGTNVRLGLASRNHLGKIIVEDICKLPGNDFSNLDEAIEQYLSKLNTRPTQTGLALAGPLIDGCITLTNRHWTVCENKLKQKFQFKNARIYNDFAAMARAVPECCDEDFTVLNSGHIQTDDPVLVAGPGTGFGMAILLPNQGRWSVLSSEGGHQAYAPQSTRETEILHILQQDHDYVSLELVSAGSGMNGIHKAVCKRLGQIYELLDPAVIRERALEGDRACLDVCEIRANAIMGAIGDMALAAGTRGGIVIAGGVAKRLMDFIDTPSAMARYFKRGPRSQYVKDIPVRVLQKQGAALYGVAALIMDEPTLKTKEQNYG